MTTNDVNLCLYEPEYNDIRNAFQIGIKSTHIQSGCVEGLIRVQLDATVARKLMLTISNALPPQGVDHDPLETTEP
jgi:hypothetical protein